MSSGYLSHARCPACGEPRSPGYRLTHHGRYVELMRLISYMSPGFPRSLFERIGEVVGAEVEFDETHSGPVAPNDPFADNSFDLGWVCSTSYVEMATRNEDPTITLAGVAWVPDDPGSNGRPIYFGDIITRADSGITTFDDLEGRTVACNDEVSLSGNYALRFAIRDRGLSEGFLEQVFTGAHHNSIDQVLSGEVDAAVVDSVVRIGRARNNPAVADLRIVERLGPWPVQPLVARSTLDADTIAEVRRLLLDAASDPLIKAELDKASLAGLVEVGPDHYDAVRAALRGQTDNR